MESPKNMLNILIIEDHQVLADGVKALLCKEPDLQITHHALDAASSWRILKGNPEIHLILLDINLPDKDGIILCQEILLQYPNLPIIALTMHQEGHIISRMVKAGAKGYLLKNTGKTELLHAIRTVIDGDTYFNPEVTKALLTNMSPHRASQKISGFLPKITRREKEVLTLIADECTTEEIAKRLFISTSTVITHRKSLLRKLNAKNSVGLIRSAFELNLLY